MKNSFIIGIVWTAVIVGMISFGATVFFIDNASKQEQNENNEVVNSEKSVYITNESSIRMNTLANLQLSSQNDKNLNSSKTNINNNEKIEKLNDELIDEDVDVVYDNDETLESMGKNINSFIRPIKGEIINPLSIEELVYSKTLEEWNIHTGTDYRAQLGTEVYSVDDGKIKEIKFDYMYGNCITIAHDNGYDSIYSNITILDELKVGDIVKQGEHIGYVAESFGFEAAEETHLHFELKKDGKYMSI